MILAAGRGERLRPITDSIPKPLIEIDGITMLERSILTLKKAGVFQFIINTWHLAEKVESFLRKNNNFGVDMEISREKYLLDTGGGLKKASWFFKGDESFFVYNCDILCDFDLNFLKKKFAQDKYKGVLAVKKRPSSRKFIFDEKGLLCGWSNLKTQERIISRPTEKETEMPFCGIQLLSTEIFDFFPEKEKFSLTELYLEISKKGEPISFFEYESGLWHDIGDPEKLSAARRSLQKMR